MSRVVEANHIDVYADDDVDPTACAIVARGVSICLRGLRPRSVEARVRLTALASNAVTRPALVQAWLEIDGRHVRAQVAAGSFDTASQQLVERLELQLNQFLSGPRPRGWPHNGEFLRPEPVSVAVGRRTIVRRKAFQLDTVNPHQAAYTMDLRDCDFHLFVDSDTGQDSVVFRVGPTGYRLTRLDALAPIPTSGVFPITIDVYPVPTGTPERIAARLDATNMDHRFFLDADTNRGAVLYRRYDGHYGLVRPETS